MFICLLHLSSLHLLSTQVCHSAKKLASNPDLGAYRVMAALEQMGIKLSRATCGRLLALNTRYLDKHGFLRFSNWKFYGERGLAHQPVAVWVYEGTLKIEYQATTLSKYTVELQEDHRHVREVSNPRLADTPFPRLYPLG
jgi:hypothetical protein